MPHAALWVVQPYRFCRLMNEIIVSMPHAALWVVQLPVTGRAVAVSQVSMPHAALWVVQRFSAPYVSAPQLGFNAARGFVGGAAVVGCVSVRFSGSFNAARGFVGGAAPTGA